jgi:proteasome lid subunit RPN8/RPN11
MNTTAAIRMATPANEYEVRSLTDHIRLLDLQRSYGEVGGMEQWMMEGIAIEEQRIRDGCPTRSRTDPAGWREEVRMVEGYFADRYGLHDELRRAQRAHTHTRGTTATTPPKADRWWEKDRVQAEAERWWPDQESIPVYQVAGETVAITRRAHLAIRDECERWEGSVETGGGLVINASGSRPAIIKATVEASNRHEASVCVDSFAIRSTTRNAARSATARITPGHWHTHPSGGCEPSRQDLNVWGRLLEESRASEIVALIVTEHRDGGWWRAPQLHGFRVRFGQKPSGLECLRVEACRVDVVS